MDNMLDDDLNADLEFQSEVDEPLHSRIGHTEDEFYVENVSPEERERRRQDKRYYTAFKLIVGCLVFLGLIYIIQVISSGILKGEMAKSTDNIIEIIKTLLFTLSGYLFARKESGND